MNFLKVLTLSISLFIISNKSFSQCFEIESILVDACDNGTDEGYNEMFRMKIGGTALNTSTLSVNWPAQTWLGLVQNATTASKVAQLNANIASTGGCGLILEPTGGVLPANSTVIVVTSQNLDITLNSFSSLSSTIYMIFQNNPSTTGGHFANYNLPAATRTLSVTFGAGCSDSVTYQRANLVNIFGTVGGTAADLNGSTVNFTPSGTASYVNNGCVAPVQPFTVEAGTTPVAACAGQTINLSGTAQGHTSVTWSAASGSFSAANNLLTSYTVPATATSGSSITLTLTATNSCSTNITDTVVINITGVTLTLDSANNNQNICSGNPIAPIQYTFGGGATSVNVTGLPTGVTATTSGNTVTISGTPSASFSYTIATVNGCGGTSLSGSISLNNYITPTFTPILPMCAGATSSPLPLVSNEGITGIWTPAFNNNTSTNYTFIPDPAQCALTAQMTVQIFPIPTVIATNLAPSFCSGGTTNIQLSSNVSGATFSWTVTGGNIVGAIGTSGNSINQLLSVSSGTTSTVEVTYTIIAEANGCAGPPVEVKVQVTPIPDLQIATGTNPICSGETTSISFSGSVPRTVFHWVITGISGITGASNGSGTSIQQALSTTGSSQGSVTYEITPTLNGCIGPSQSITVLVNPRPEMFTNSTHPDICSGDLTNISIGTFNNNTVLTWTVNPVGVNGASSGSNTGLSTTIIQELTTSGNAQGYVDYTITPSLAGCDGTSFTVRVYVNPLPEPKLVDGAICVDASGIPFQTYTLDSGLDNATYDFIWYFNGVAIPNTNNATYTANEVGVYGVVATNSTTNCHSSNGTNMVIANVISVTPATSLTYTQSNYFSGNATVIINITGGTGTLMYSLDDGTFQTSNIFTNLSAGLHTITVIDTQGCTHFTQDIFIIEYPQYFTPNGDGYNDTWFISGLKNTDLISIFDRYGKLIKQLRGEEFWDGTYNQQQLPSTDYWFTVDYLENGVKKLFKAHFAMKR